MSGLAAYKTYLGMMLHFTGAVDGWQYNFTGKVSMAKFESNKRLMYMYAAIERDFPTKLDQIRFFYPAFRAAGYVKADSVMYMRKLYRHHMKFYADPAKAYADEFNQLIADDVIEDISDLLKNDGLFPNICELSNRGKLSQDMATLLFIVLPALNTITSNEPIVFESWKSKVLVDMKFIQLYISQPQLKGLGDATVAAIQTLIDKSKQTQVAH